MVSAIPASTSILLRAENLGRQVNGKVLVEAATFELPAGKMVAIAGASGAGKSSLLRLLNRLDEPTSGTVYVEGIDYRRIEPRVLRRRVGLVTQRPFLFPGTVAANLNYGPVQRGEIPSHAAIEQLLALVGLRDYISRDVANLSGGEAQRVSLARTLANSPRILLLDEPTASLDQASKVDIEGLLRTIVREQNLACAIVTHESAQAQRLADTVMMMEKGRIIRIVEIGQAGQTITSLQPEC